ncbi:MAG: hypothetical protein H6Q73_2981 [Firmicutes bacterium]|nr:hypothetical protein [Bacillota bacterium]
MAKVYQIAFQLAGKLGANFHSTFMSASKQINGLDQQIKKLKQDMKGSGANKGQLQGEIDGLLAQKAKFTAAQNAADKFKKSSSEAFKAASITAGVATAAVTGYYASAMKLANGVMEHAKHAQTAAKITGVSAEWYEKMSYVAKAAGINIENFDKSLAKMTINLGEAKQGNKEMITTFAKLGISVKELQGMKPEQAFLRVAQGLNGITDAAVRTDLARKVFGKVGTSMIPLTKMSIEQIRALEKEAKHMGIVLNDSALEQAKTYRLAKNRFDAVWSGTKLGIGQALMPGLAAGTESISKLAVKYQPAIRNFAKDFGQGIKAATPEILKAVKAVAGLASMGYRGAKAFSNLIGGFHNLVYVSAAWIVLKMAVALFNTGKAMLSVGRDTYKLIGYIRNLHIVTALMNTRMRILTFTTKAWAAAQRVLNFVMNANPIMRVVTAAIALGTAAVWVYKNWDKVKNLLSWIADKWNTMKDALSAGGTRTYNMGAYYMPGFPGHAAGGIFNREHIARFAEGNMPEAAIALDGSARSKAIWQQAGQMMGMVGVRSGSGIIYNDNRVFNISGNQREVAAGIDQSNKELMRRLESLQSNEERLSYG